MLYVLGNLKLSHTLTWFYLVVKLPRLIIFFRPTRKSKKSKKKSLKKNCEEHVRYRSYLIPSSIINERNSCYGTKPYITGTEAIPRLVHSLQNMNHNDYHQQRFFDDLKLLPHKLVRKKAFQR